jgi:hypothetical protein
MKFFNQLPILLGKIAILVGFLFTVEGLSPVVLRSHGVFLSDGGTQRAGG